MKKLSDMGRKVAVFLWVCALALTSASATTSASPGKDIASTTLCGDAYLLALAPERIGALSWQSRDPLALTPPDLIPLPQIWDDTETLIRTDATFIVLGAGEGEEFNAVNQNPDKHSMSLNWVENYTGIIKNIEAIGDLIHEKKQADALIVDIQSRLASLAARNAARGTNPKILYLSRSGATAGPGTYVDAVIRAAGGVNIINTPGWNSPDAEFLVTLTPDLIVTSFFTDGYESVQAKAVRHRVLQNFIRTRARLDVPGALWPCASPHMIAVSESIADALDGLASGDLRAEHNP